MFQHSFCELLPVALRPDPCLTGDPEAQWIFKDDDGVEMSHDQELASQQRRRGPSVAVKEPHLVPNRYSLGGADLDTGRCEWLQVAIVVSRDDLYLGDYLNETIKELRNILPFFQLDLGDRVFHIAKQNELSRMGILDDLAKLLKQTRDL